MWDFGDLRRNKRLDWVASATSDVLGRLAIAALFVLVAGLKDPVG